MDVLSTKDGSAQAVRDAAASEAIDSRLALERELDRLNVAIGAHSTASAQHLQWSVLAQAFLLASYLIVLVGGWSLPLPGKRWLLAAIAGFAVVSLVLGHLSQRGSRDRIAPLRQSRRLVEHALERIAARPVVFSRDGVISRSVGDWADHPDAARHPCRLGRAHPVHTGPALADRRQGCRGAAWSIARRCRARCHRATAPRAKGPARKGEDIAPAPVAAETAAPEESGLAALFRRALSAPPAETDASAEPVKP